MRGVSAVIRVGAPALRARGAVLGSIRALRQYASDGTVPAGFENHVEPGRVVVLGRTMADGYRMTLALEPVGDAQITVDAGGRVTASAGPGKDSFFLRATALTDEPPLNPIPEHAILTGAAIPDQQSRDALAFLAYREKLLAGSWRFLTYFGRDTLISLEMLMPVLTPAPIEAGLGSVIARLGKDGEVAHEEAIGEWAVLDNRLRNRPGDPRAPVLDYSMVDDDFLLAPALARYLLDTPEGRARASAFLATRTAAGVTYRDAARKNLARVIALAAPFTASRSPADLIALRPGTHAGNWRDSNTGLGEGRVPYDVNAALVPAALVAAARLYESPLFARDPGAAATARASADAWRAAAAPFRVEIPEAEARARVAAYATAAGIDPAAALATIDGPVVLDALSLDASGTPVPVLHSDVAFRWLYDAPSSADLAQSARRLFAPFPAGLLTPVGVLVANPAFAADPATRALFTTHDYHGTVVWSWQQALIAAGIEHQLARTDLHGRRAPRAGGRGDRAVEGDPRHPGPRHGHGGAVVVPGGGWALRSRALRRRARRRRRVERGAALEHRVPVGAALVGRAQVEMAARRAQGSIVAAPALAARSLQSTFGRRCAGYLSLSSRRVAARSAHHHGQ
ncbi:MAG: hypothetical protein QM820_43985 [Minicystis sp.]